MNTNKHYYPEEHSGVCVVRRKGETDEELLRRFRKKFSKSGIIKEYKERMFYEKPSDKKRRKLSQSLRAKKREEEKLLSGKIKKFNKKKPNFKKGMDDDKSSR